MSATIATPVRRSSDSLVARIDRFLPLRFWNISLIFAILVAAGIANWFANWFKGDLPPVWLAAPALLGCATALPCRFIAAKIDDSSLSRLNGFVVALAIGLAIVWQWAEGLLVGAEFHKLSSQDQTRFVVTAAAYLGSIIGVYAGLAILRRDEQ